MKHPQIIIERNIVQATVDYLRLRRANSDFHLARMNYSSENSSTSNAFTTKMLARALNSEPRAIPNLKLINLVLDYHLDPRNQESTPDTQTVEGRSIWIAYKVRGWRPERPSSSKTLYPFMKYGMEYNDIIYANYKWIAK